MEEQHHVPTHFAPRTGRTLAIVVSAATVLLAIGFLIVHHRKASFAESLASQKASAAAAAPVVDVARVRYSANTEPLTMPGSTTGWYESTIYARVTGYVANWTADIGDHVKSGQVLARIDTPDLDARLIAAQAKLAAAESDVSVAESAVALAKTTYDRWWNSPIGVVSQQERDEKKAEYDSSVAKLRAANAQVKINQADVTSLLAFTQYKNVTAPFDGIITARKIDIGDLVSAGSTSATTFLYSIAQSDRLRVFIDVPQSASAGLKVTMPAVVRAGEYPDRKFSGRISRTANSIDPASRTLHVEVDIENKDFALVPGMYVQVSFNLVQTPLLQVPASALLFRAAGTQIAVVGDDGIVHFQKVTIADDEGNLVDIAGGVAPNANVALNLSSQIADGERVTPSEIAVDAPAGHGPVSAAK
ncbi:MAG TPA: efflux RND transporter periplasmic adaptor subunit [Tepidisphaeraceae bacterium]|jgi:RND family efflux transporter MFP subunit|nr:efflux RND transporter periplasmic adaptor subunit [Tepidisphaeraceae bacterium]